MSVDLLTEVVLGEHIHGEVVLQNVDVAVALDGAHQCAFHLGTREVLMVEDTVLGVTALTVERVATLGGLVETSTPADEVLDTLGSSLHNLPHGSLIALAGATHKGVLDVFLEGVGWVGNTANTTLGVVGVTLVHFAFRYNSNVSLFGCFEGKTQARNSAADNQKIGSFLHFVSLNLLTRHKSTKEIANFSP